MKRIPALAVALLALAPSARAAEPAKTTDLKIGYIIAERLVVETDVGKAAAKQLKSRMENAQNELEKKLGQVKDLEADLKKRAMVLSEEERNKASEELEKQMLDVKRLKEDFQRSLQKAQGEVMGKVNEYLREVIQRYGDEHGFDLILDASSMLYVSDKPDLTDDVIQAANAGKPR